MNSNSVEKEGTLGTIRNMYVEERLGNPSEGYNQRAFIFREVKYVEVPEKPKSENDFFIQVFRGPEKSDSRPGDTSGAVVITEYPKTVEAEIAINTSQTELALCIDRTGRMKAEEKITTVDRVVQTAPVSLNSDRIAEGLATLLKQREILINSGFNKEDLDSLIGKMRGQVGVARAIMLALRISEGKKVDESELNKAFKDMEEFSSKEFVQHALPAIEDFGQLMAGISVALSAKRYLGKV